MQPILSSSECDALFLAIRDHGQLPAWNAALGALLPAFRDTLPARPQQLAEAFVTIQQLNITGRLIDGTVPMQVVLAKLAILSPLEAMIMLAKQLGASAEGRIGIGGGGAPVRYEAPAPEAYAGDGDELLPFDFMLGGHTAGRSVVRLLVPRHEAGQPSLGSSGPRVFKGTGWLIAKDLVITNFHVLCARESDESDPGPADLELQVGKTTVELDYDREGATPIAVPVLEAVALGQRGGARDYALLRVQPQGTWPPPLRLRTGKPSIPSTGFPVNIIQHPQGWPKRVAARSNLLKAATADELQYLGDTLGGSSGSPLCNDAWEVIGLHRASGPASGVTIKGRAATAYNVGVPIDAILRDLEQRHAPVFAEISPNILS